MSQISQMQLELDMHVMWTPANCTTRVPRSQDTV